MTEEIKKEVEQVIEEAPITEQQIQPFPDPKEQLRETNLRNIAKRLQEEERRAKEAELRAQQYERELQQVRLSQQQIQQTQLISEEEELFGDPDDYVANKQLQQTTKKIKAKQTDTEKQLSYLEQKLAILEAKDEMKTMADFKEVVNDENLKTLAMLYPDEYHAWQQLPDLRSKTKVGYNMIKNYGIAHATPVLKQEQQIKMAEKRIEANKSKPISAATTHTSSSPLSKFGRYDPDGRLVMDENDAKRIISEARRKTGQSSM